MHGRRHALQGGVAGVMHVRGDAWQGACVTGRAEETATAVDGTYPSGMHSC